MATPPPNDNFSGKLTLTVGVTVTSNTTEATIEPNEPAEVSNFSPGHSIWYTFTPTADSIVSIDNIGTQTYKPYIAVYMGSSLSNLVSVDYTEAFGTEVLRLSFPAKAGTIFQIVIGNHSTGGNVQLTLTTQPFNHAGPLFGPDVPTSRMPANDSFIQRSSLTGSDLTVISYLRDATIEAGEPDRPFTNVSHTVWFKWTAPSTSVVTIDTTGTTVSPHFFAVYVGDTIQSLATVAGSLSSGNPTTDTFPTVAGATYIISAGSRFSSRDGALVLTLTSAPPYSGSLLNLSTRMAVGTGNDVLIGGFIIKNGPKDVVLRAIGPSLRQFGISDALSDPSLELHNGAGTLIFQNNNWQDDQNQALTIQASGLAPTDPRESALRLILDPGNYTAVVRGLNHTTGVGLVELYDAQGAGAASKAANVATRGFVSTRNSVMIAGFVVGGGSKAHLIIRGIGPSLASFGVANALQNPELELYDSNGHKLVTVDNWQDASNYGQVIAAGLAPTDLRESAISAIFDPGDYTAIVRGLNGTVGVGLVEVYNQAP